MSEVPAEKNSRPRYKPYPKCKDSGVEWLGEIPEHWEVTRTKFVARQRSGHTPSRLHPEYWENCTIPWFGLADVWQIRDGRKEYVSETNEKISELGLANSAARRLPKGTVILSRTASVGFSAILEVDMATTQDFVNWVCGERIRPEYLLYVFRSMQHEFTRLTMGSTHQTIYTPDVGRFSTSVPSLEEQDRIVAFVRRRSSLIERLVAKKECLIELLQEKRTALITRAVTKGLDPNVPMKDSGVEWLGEIPARWGVKQLNVALLPDDNQYILSQRVVLLRPSHEILVSEYLQYFLTSMAFRQGIESRATGSTAEGIKRRYLMSMPVCLPPIPQQRAVATMLDFETVRIDALIAKVRTAIDRLRELRTALISAAVTGKIDVREEAP